MFLHCREYIQRALWLVCLLTSTQLFAQNQDLEKLLDKVESLRNNNLDSALVLALKARTIARQAPVSSVRARAFRELASIYSMRGLNDSAFITYEQSLLEYRRIPDHPGSGTALKGMGISLYLLGNYAESLSAYFEALELLDSTTHNKDRAAIYNNIGLMLGQQKMLAEAESFYARALRIWTSLNDSTRIPTVLNNIAEIASERGDHRQAIDMTLQALQYQKSMRDLVGQGISYNNLADYYHKLQQLDLALTFNDSSIYVRNISGNKPAIAQSLLNRSKIHQSRHDLKSADAAGSAALAIADQFNRTDLQIKILNQLAEVNETIGNKERYQYYLVRYAKQVDKANQPNVPVEITRMVYQHRQRLEAERAQAINDLQLQAKEKELNRSVVFAAALALILLLVIAYLITRIYYSKKLRQSLSEMERLHQELSASYAQIALQKIKIENINGSLEQEIQKRTADLVERNRQLKEYAHFNSHMLRSPLSSLLGLQGLLKENPPQIEIQEYLELSERLLTDLDEQIKIIQKVVTPG